MFLYIFLKYQSAPLVYAVLYSKILYYFAKFLNRQNQAADISDDKEADNTISPLLHSKRTTQMVP
jgi:hypothetical protein